MTWRLARKRATLWRRAKIMTAVRCFFSERDYLEVETPCRIPAPAPEAHIDAVPSGEWFLQTSPELCMKRLLAAGYPKIFQICKCFREGERGDFHLPEFTMLEWYEVGADCGSLMMECEALVRFLAASLSIEEKISWKGSAISLEVPWKRMTVAEAFVRYSPLPLDEALRDHRFDEMLAIHVEPHLGLGKPLFLYDYPASLASLAKVRSGDHAWAERFELYASGVELANGFSELTDPQEQRDRFLNEINCRRSLGKTIYPLPEPFLDDLSRMPDCAGIALGLDRLIMLLTGVSSVDGVVAFTPEML